MEKRKKIELEIKTLKNTPRDADRLGGAFANRAKTKGTGRSYAHRRHTERLVTEIEMLKVALCLVARRCRRDSIIVRHMTLHYY